MTEETYGVMDIKPIETAPDLERVMVCGYQKPRNGVFGYWWWLEDICVNGVAIESPHASHWFPIVLPEFPDMPGDFKDTHK